jgi:hypothetical protein
VRRPVALVVVLPVATPLARLEPGDRWDPIRVLAPRRLQDRAGHGTPLRALHRPGHAPVVGGEPGLGGPRNNARDRRVVDSVVVPVEQVDQVAQAQPPGGVAGLVAGTGGQAALALDHEDLDLLGPCQLQGNSLAGGRRLAVSGRPGVELQERVFPSISAWPGAPRRRSLRRSSQVSAQRRHPGRRRVRSRSHGAQHLVEDRQGWRRRAGRCGRPKDEAVAKGRHGLRMSQRTPPTGGATGTGAPSTGSRRDAALAVVQGEVDRLVDDLRIASQSSNEPTASS